MNAMGYPPDILSQRYLVRIRKVQHLVAQSAERILVAKWIVPRRKVLQDLALLHHSEGNMVVSSCLKEQ